MLQIKMKPYYKNPPIQLYGINTISTYINKRPGGLEHDAPADKTPSDMTVFKLWQTLFKVRRDVNFQG